ncbi:MAG: glutamate carboxypeptidase [Acidobacteria bacterium]|nr:glutamate carboxypeptidase [Acidobacteriota bacterium]
MIRPSRPLLVILGALVSTWAFAQSAEQVRTRVQQERQPYLDTLRELVSIESGSGDVEGLNRIAEVIAGRLRALGGDVEFVDPPANMVRFENTPPRTGKSVVGRFRGTGTRRILLVAHMDTVYLRGMLAKQPFRTDGDRAYGLGISDDKHGVALILHTIGTLNALNFRDYGLITVLINGDEEVSSAGSRTLITKLGSEHELVLSCEGAGQEDSIRLTTSGIAAVQLKVTGRASHAGGAPEQGRNALYELAHQMLQTRDLSNPATGVKMNWTLANGGSARNVIPAEARATADVRVLRIADYDGIEKQVRDRIRNPLIPDTKVDMVFERTRPPLEATAAARSVAAHAQRIYKELGKSLLVQDTAPGGGTDAAFAALETRAAVIEGLGLKGFGAHSNDAEYIEISSIEPRLYLMTRLIMDAAQGKAGNTTN